MSMNRNLRYVGTGLGAIALALGVALTPSPAAARVIVGFGFGVPMVAPAPYYYAAPPVVYAPPPVIYAPPPQPAYVSQAQASWYYCDNPRGYYPYIATCSSGWHEVPAQPPQQGAAPPQ